MGYRWVQVTVKMPWGPGLFASPPGRNVPPPR